MTSPGREAPQGSFRRVRRFLGKARHAFLAIEGLFLLRGQGLTEADDRECDDVFAFALAGL